MPAYIAGDISYTMDGPSHPSGNVPPTGLTVVFDPPEASADIVFVHGFTGHPERTWTHKNGAVPSSDRGDNHDDIVEPPSKSRKLGFFSQATSSRTKSQAVYWPRHLLPETIPLARVLTYGYDTHIRHWIGPAVTKSTVYDIAWDFLVALEAERRDDPTRPLIFVVHSLGGIVIKELLRRSSGCQLGQSHLRCVFESTTGIMFFGTPHSGADPLPFFRRITEMVAAVAGFSAPEHIVNALLPSSERLRELRDEFGPMALQQGWIIHSFQEQHGVKALNGRKVVDDTSSYLNLSFLETTQHIGRNHMDMCRFTGVEDVEYKKISSALQRMATNVPTGRTRGRRTTAAIGSSNSENQAQILLDLLRFDQLDARRTTIKKAHTKTCKWLLKCPAYIDWLDINNFEDHHGFLWIKGKPGTGKSTLMKYAFTNAYRTTKNTVVISFFFNARGEMLEKSTLGMFRSLVLQVIERVPEIRKGFDSLDLATVPGSYQWSVEALKELFGHAVQMSRKSPIICFIDALDECDEREVRDMVSYFEYLGELCVSVGVRFQVCFSSRYYPNITLVRGLILRLEHQEGHGEDIENYLSTELKIGRTKLAEEVRAEVQEKSSGVFMWVVLVADILNKEHDDGNMHTLRKKLRDIPAELHELFRDILTRDKLQQDRLLLCIQWVLFARTPRRPEELYFAILSGIQPDILESWNADEVTESVIEKFLLSSSKGLVEVTKSACPTVQFIHESVRDFLLKEDGLHDIWSDSGADSNFQARSHERLKQCCINYIAIDVFNSENSQEPSDLTAMFRSYPFLEYAVHEIFYHADAAQGAGLSQEEFLRKFQLARWIELRNKFGSSYSATASLLYILAESDTANLIRLCPADGSYVKPENEPYGIPLFASLATSSANALRAFLELEAKTPSLGILYDFEVTVDRICKIYSTRSWESRNFDRDFTFWKDKPGDTPPNPNILLRLDLARDNILALFLLDRGRVELSPSWITQLSRDFANSEELRSIASPVKTLQTVRDPAVKLLAGYELFVSASNIKDIELQKALINAKCVDPNFTRIGLSNSTSIGLFGCVTPLFYVAGNGPESIIRLLLESGRVLPQTIAPGYQKLQWLFSPIKAAADSGQIECLSLLIRESKKTQGHKSWTPLHQAVLEEDQKFIKRLFATHEFEGDEPDHDGRTALWHAIQYRSARDAVEMASLLLELGRNVASVADDHGVSPLDIAERRAVSTSDWKAVVEILREQVCAVIQFSSGVEACNDDDDDDGSDGEHVNPTSRDHRV
ncbi:hypothetical protein CONLIGDRAFT_271607 [Coniochaeta ligniaria NRRL 30616]|uniref:Nephrocystin 3-like N-terminal domain-containing protein n=1 Tax=Coniochaeta ligniaria NRRL 30616 TaxID=1408157 RepID=A0A1J7JR97_9PEZI|nr:hypothetical protein CONLIGDRAFT_271607 [Coniochaeta ligniaria NRRL 30616]